MRDEDRRQPLTDGSIMEYLVHGEFAYKESDVNSTFGAWWVPLRRMIKELGKEVVEKELEAMDSEAMQIRLQVFDDALEDDSSHRCGPGGVPPGGTAVSASPGTTGSPPRQERKSSELT